MRADATTEEALPTSSARAEHPDLIEPLYSLLNTLLEEGHDEAARMGTAPSELARMGAAERAVAAFAHGHLVRDAIAGIELALAERAPRIELAEIDRSAMLGGVLDHVADSRKGVELTTPRDGG